MNNIKLVMIGLLIPSLLMIPYSVISVYTTAFIWMAIDRMANYPCRRSHYCIRFYHTVS
jgi:hypothetical protein